MDLRGAAGPRGLTAARAPIRHTGAAGGDTLARMVRTLPAVEQTEAAARRTLRDQVARLEREHARLVAAAFPDELAPTAAAPAGVARLLSLGELEAERDALTGRLTEARRALAVRAERRERARLQLERMLLDPGSHRFVRVAAADLGERGCGVYHVRPRLGLVGMLAGWWQVKLSSGCPLPF